MRILLELDRGMWIACSPAIAFFFIMLAAFSVDLYLQNRKPK